MQDYLIFINGKLAYPQVFHYGTPTKDIEAGILKDLPSHYKIKAVAVKEKSFKA